MRRLLIAFGLIGLVTPALAADYDLPTLRGSQMLVPASPTYFNWEGLYVGGQIGYASSGANFGNAMAPLIDYSLRNLRVNQDIQVSQLTVLPKVDTNGNGFGGFLGYNWQFDQAVVGLELNYNRMNVEATASDSIERVFSDPNVSANYAYAVSVSGQSSIRVTDLATLRTRAAYVMDNFLPYGFVGLAVGRADISNSASVAFCGFDPTAPAGPPSQDPVGSQCFNPVTGVPTPVPQTPATKSKMGEFIMGFSAGVGTDVMLWQNVFLRGEYEYVQITSLQDLHFYLNNFRLGLGVKF
jgi:opacity protein-like surface antigen